MYFINSTGIRHRYFNESDIIIKLREIAKKISSHINNDIDTLVDKIISEINDEGLEEIFKNNQSIIISDLSKLF